MHACRLRQCWYSAAAAKNISEEAHDEGEIPEEDGEAALALERRLHAPPAIQFVSESRRGGFNKARIYIYFEVYLYVIPRTLLHWTCRVRRVGHSVVACH